jgi:hypothetical protein
MFSWFLCSGNTRQVFNPSTSERPSGSSDSSDSTLQKKVSVQFANGVEAQFSTPKKISWGGNSKDSSDEEGEIIINVSAIRANADQTPSLYSQMSSGALSYRNTPIEDRITPEASAFKGLQPIQGDFNCNPVMEEESFDPQRPLLQKIKELNLPESISKKVSSFVENCLFKEDESGFIDKDKENFVVLVREGACKVAIYRIADGSILVKKLDKLLGRGSYGSVYRLVDQYNQSVAIKIPRTEGLESFSEEEKTRHLQESQEGISREIKVLKELNSLGIEGIQKEPQGFVYEWDGVSCSPIGFMGEEYAQRDCNRVFERFNVVSKNTLTEKEAVAWLYRIVKAVKGLKDNNRINVDLKAGNLFVKNIKEGTIDIADLDGLIDLDHFNPADDITLTSIYTPHNTAVAIAEARKSLYQNPHDSLAFAKLSKALEQASVSQLGMIAYQCIYGSLDYCSYKKVKDKNGASYPDYKNFILLESEMVSSELSEFIARMINPDHEKGQPTIQDVFEQFGVFYNSYSIDSLSELAS